MLQHVAVDKAGVGFGGIKVIRVLTLRVGWKIHALCTLGCVRYVAEQMIRCTYRICPSRK